MRVSLLAHELAVGRSRGQTRQLHGTKQAMFLNLLLNRPQEHPNYFKKAKECAQRGNLGGTIDAYRRALAEETVSMADLKQSLPSTSKAAAEPPLSDPQKVMRLLIERKEISEKTFLFVRRIFNDLDRHFKTPPTLEDHRTLVTAMVKSGRLSDAVKWLSNMRQSYNVRPSVEDYNFLCRAFRKQMEAHRGQSSSETSRSIDAIRDVITLMRKSGLKPDGSTYNILISALLGTKRIRYLEQVDGDLKSMKEEGVQLDVAMLTNLLSGFTDTDKQDKAEAAYNDLSLLLEKGQEIDTRTGNAILKYVGHFQGSDAMYSLLASMQIRDPPFSPNAQTLTSLVEGAFSQPHGFASSAEAERKALDILRQASSALAVRPTVSAAVSVISRLSKKTSDTSLAVEAAQSVYDKLRAEGMPAHSALIQSLLDVMCASDAQIPLERVQTIYYDMVNPDTATVDVSPDAQIFSAFLTLAACCKGAGATWALELLGDMRDDGLTFHSPSITANHVTALMQASDSFTQAFSIYSWLAILTPSPFVRSQYNAFLAQFARLSFPPDGQSTAKSRRGEAPPELFNEFLKDMRKSGSPPDTQTYSIMLSYYSRQSRNPEQIRRLHDAIKMDAQYDPDTALLNSLIVAYGYVRDFGAAFGVWKSMLANNHRQNAKIDHTTISCILDVCASTRSFSAAHKVWTTVTHDLALSPNRRNWETWLECLCRCEAFTLAKEVYFKQMLRGLDGAPQADARGLEILLTIAYRSKQSAYEDILEEARKSTPNFLATLKLPRMPSVSSAESNTIGNSDKANHDLSDSSTRILAFMPLQPVSFT